MQVQITCLLNIPGVTSINTFLKLIDQKYFSVFKFRLWNIFKIGTGFFLQCVIKHLNYFQFTYTVVFYKINKSYYTKVSGDDIAR